MDNLIFLDTSFIIACKIENDHHHERSFLILEKIGNGEIGTPVISDYIFDEVVSVMLRKTKDLLLAEDLGVILKSSMRIINITEEIFESAWQIFKEQKDTKFSFTDCTVLALMKEKSIKNLATFDKDFKRVKEINVIE